LKYRKMSCSPTRIFEHGGTETQRRGMN
jgi:hypothetical protein